MNQIMSNRAPLLVCLGVFVGCQPRAESVELVADDIVDATTDREEVMQESPSLNMPIRVDLLPSDRVSDVGETPLRIVVSRQGPKVDDATIDKLIESIVLTTDDGERVDVISALVPSTTVNDFYEPRYIDIHPTSALRSVWHELDVTIASELLDLTDDIGADGVVRSRFHPGHAPTMRQVRACRQDDAWHVRMFFSERVLFDAQTANLDAVPFSVNFGGIHCSPLANYVPSGHVDPDAEETTDMFQFSCRNDEPGDDSLPGALVISQTDELKSPDGALFVVLPEAPAVARVEFQERDSWSTSNTCVLWLAP